MKNNTPERSDPINTRCVYVSELVAANPTLSIEKAANFAGRIAAAEAREDFEEMYKLLLEAIYGPSRDAAA